MPTIIASMFRRFPRTRSILGLLLCLAAGSAAARADIKDLTRVETLAKGGAPDLALRLLERDAPPATDTAAWMAWEKQRIAIYVAQRDWNAVTQRADQIPDNIPAYFRRWMLTQAAQARLTASDSRGARRYLRRLIWQESGSAEEFALWRRLVVRSYLMEGDLTDAQTALLRYQQDSMTTSDVWQTLRAEILLRAKRDREAYDVLAGAQSYEARELRLLSALRSGMQRPADVYARAGKLAEELRTQPMQARDAWGVVAEAAARNGNPAGRVVALENALALPAPAEPLAPVTADDLWQAYDRLAESFGNEQHLVVGNDSGWFARAKSYLEPPATRTAKGKAARAKRKAPPGPAYLGRALMAFLTRHAQDDAVRAAAHQWLAGTLFADGQGEIVQALYTESARYPSVDSIPDTVRYLLADKALAEYDIRLAAQLIKGLVNPPQGEDKELWSLRRSRVLIYAGDYKAALVLLSGMLDDHRKLDPDFADRYLQVIFDLQAAGKNAEALVLLESVFQRVDNRRMRREILYWRADSQATLGKHEAAAELYLRSALYDDSNGDDPWGQTARFHAAEELGKAGLVDDARGVYRKLLQSTDDPKRRAMIERQIQQLWLAPTKVTTP